MTCATLLVFQAGGRRLAVPSSSLVAVAGLDALTPLPLTPPEHLGLLLHAGTLVPVMDPLCIAGLGTLRTPPALAVVVDACGQALGLGCHRVEGTAPAAVPAPGEGAVAAEAKVAGWPATVLFPDRWVESKKP